MLEYYDSHFTQSELMWKVVKWFEQDCLGNLWQILYI